MCPFLNWTLLFLFTVHISAFYYFKLIQDFHFYRSLIKLLLIETSFYLTDN